MNHIRAQQRSGRHLLPFFVFAALLFVVLVSSGSMAGTAHARQAEGVPSAFEHANLLSTAATTYYMQVGSTQILDINAYDRNETSLTYQWYVAKTGSDNNTCQSPTSPCLTIQGAIDKASAGDTVHVAAGTYNEPVTLLPNMTLLGAGPDSTIISWHDVVGGSRGVINGADGAVVAYFTLAYDGSGHSGYGYSGNDNISITFHNNVFRDHYVGISSGEGNGNFHIYNNVFINNYHSGVAFGWYQDPIIHNNVFMDNGNAIHYYSDGSVSPRYDIDYNLYWNNTNNTDSGVITGTYDIFVNPLFVDVSSNNYHLQGCSEAIDAGDPTHEYSNEPLPNGGRINIGAYGNTDEATVSNACSGPPNDNFNNAISIDSLPYTNTQDTVDATTAADDPIPGCGYGNQNSNSVWYRYEASTTGTLTISTLGSNYDTVLAVWTGSRGSLNQVVCNDDHEGFQSMVDVSVEADVTYHIEVMDYAAPGGGNLILAATIDYLTAPPRPTTRSPRGTITTNRPSYVWNEAGGARSYQLRVAGPSGRVINAWYDVGDEVTCSGGRCSIRPTQTLAQGDYTWRVRARNEHGTSAWSASRSFTVNLTPPAPTLRSPHGTITTPLPTYTWNAVSGARRYQLRVAGPTGRILNAWYKVGDEVTCSGGICSVTPDLTLTHGADYTWRLRARNRYRGGPWSRSMRFTVNLAPPAPTLRWPNGTITTDRPAYRWEEVPGAIRYQLRVAGPSGRVINAWYKVGNEVTCSNGICQVRPSTRLADGDYTWRLRARNRYRGGPWCRSMRFTVR